MAAFKAPTPKPTMCISNSETIRALQTGTLGLKNLAKDETKKTVVKYQDGSGKWRYQGSKALKETQTLTFEHESAFDLWVCGYVSLLVPKQITPSTVVNLWLTLRIYTPKFASTLVGLTAEMKTEIRPSIPPVTLPLNQVCDSFLFPPRPEANPKAPAFSLLLSEAKPDVHLIAVVAELVWSSWDEGELEDALLYMMGSSRCRIPAEWAQHVPTAEHLRSL